MYILKIVIYGSMNCVIFLIQVFTYTNVIYNETSNNVLLYLYDYLYLNIYILGIYCKNLRNIKYQYNIILLYSW